MKIVPFELKNYDESRITLLFEKNCKESVILGLKSCNMKIQFLLLSLICFSFIACKPAEKENPNALTEPYQYEYERFGWKVEVPAGWELIEEQEVVDRNERGEDLIEGVLEEDIIYDQLENLLDFRYDETTVFGSSAEPFLIEYEGEWEETNELLKEIFEMTYASEGLSTEISENRTETIDGLDFMVYNIEVFEEGGDFMMQQEFYTAYINGYDFAVHLTYTDDVKGDEMREIWKSSTFDIPDFEDPLVLSGSEIDNEYYNSIGNADEAFSNENFEIAKNWYQKALNLKPAEAYPKDQIILCNEK